MLGVGGDPGFGPRDGLCGECGIELALGIRLGDEAVDLGLGERQIVLVGCHGCREQP